MGKSGPFFLIKLMMFSLNQLHSNSKARRLWARILFLQLALITSNKTIKTLLDQFGENIIHQFRLLIISKSIEAHQLDFLTKFKGLFQLFDDLNCENVSFLLEDTLM